MRGRKLKSDVAISAAFAVLRIVVLLWVVRAASEAYSPALLGAFLLSRRIAATGANLFQLGASQTLRRYVSINIDQSAAKLAYLTVALVGWVILSAITLPAAFRGRFALAEWLFPGVPDSAALAFWTSAHILALVLSYIVLSTIIAERKIALGNALDILAAGGFLIPSLLAYGAAVSPAWLLRFNTYAVVATSLLIALWYILSLRVGRIPDRDLVRRAVVDFRGYGIPRTFVTTTDMLILLIGPWLLRSQVEEAGYLLIALTLTRTIQAVIQPLTQIASVVTARLTSRQDEAKLGDGIKLLFGTVAYSSTLLVAVLVPWRDTLLWLWLADAEVIGGVRFYFDTLMWAIIPYAVFQGLKGVIEMRWFRPLNLYTLVISSVVYLASFAILSWFVGPREAVRDSTLLAFVVLGIGSLIWCRAYLRPLSYWGVHKLLAASAVLVLLNTLAASDGGVGQFFLAMIASIAVVLSLVRLRPAPYVRALQIFLLPRHQLR